MRFVRWTAARELEYLSCNLHLDPGSPATTCRNCLDVFTCCAICSAAVRTQQILQLLVCLLKGSSAALIFSRNWPDSSTVFQTHSNPLLTWDDLKMALDPCTHCCVISISWSTRFGSNWICALHCFMTCHKMFQFNWTNFPKWKSIGAAAYANNGA